MGKAEKYDWKESNMALFGSDAEKQVKKESAETELAWKSIKHECGTQIFRINKFKVEKWPLEDYGKFYNGDSYVVLHIHKDPCSDELLYDIHFWIGKYSTSDEYGTAAYKTVELDCLLDDKAIQHREVQGQESDLFKSYFEFFTIMKGGCDTGFRRVGPVGYKTRLFHIMGERKQISVTEVPLKRGNLNSEDVFVVDCGLRIYQFNGETANKDERFKATMYVTKMKGERMGKPRLDILDEKQISQSHRFYKLLPDGGSKEKEDPPENEPCMFRVCDKSGTMEIDEVCKGLDKSQLKKDDVFLVDTGKHLFVWNGRDSSPAERKSGFGFCQRYLKNKPNPLLPITILTQGQTSKDFEEAFSEA